MARLLLLLLLRLSHLVDDAGGSASGSRIAFVHLLEIYILRVLGFTTVLVVVHALHAILLQTVLKGSWHFAELVLGNGLDRHVGQLVSPVHTAVLVLAELLLVDVEVV